MRANRDDDTLYVHERRESYTVPIVAGSVALLALLLYIGLREPAATLPEAASQPVVRDSAIVAPPVVDTTTPAATTPTPSQVVPEGFNARQLSPPSSTVGAGTAPIAESANGERVVIDGALLEELEEDARSESASGESAD